MTRRFQWRSIASACVVVVALSCGPASAADKTKMSEATHRVEEGARSIGHGELGEGFTELFVGLGQTIVEGTKFTAITTGEFFKTTFGD